MQAFAVSLTYPPTLSLWLFVFGVALLVLRRRKSGVALLAFSLAWSLLWSIPRASDGLRELLERRYPIVAEGELPKVDAIVVLGGGSRYAWLDRAQVRPEDLENSRLAAGESEARMMATAIARLGVPASALLLEERSRDTRENASFTAALADRRGMRRIALITSSLHMPRASLLFHDAGFTVIPVPVPERAARDTWRQRWLPSRSALWRSGRAWKEFAGLLVAHLRK